MPAPWKIVGSSAYTREERPTSAFRLDGDVSTLIVPLRWPIAKVMEENLALCDSTKIRPLWQVLVAPSEEPDTPGYVAFPETDEELAEVFFAPDGSPLPEWPWTKDGTPAPTSWSGLFAAWYRSQAWYGERDLIEAFGKAMEVLTRIPLALAAPLLHFSLMTPAGGEDVSESKPASTSTTKKTARRSGRASTTSSPAPSSE